MNITFGICLSPNFNSLQVLNLLTSIYNQAWNNDDNFEVLLIGGNFSEVERMLKDTNFDRILYIEFDETVKSGWITRKKNILAQTAAYENLVILHDYYVLHERWLRGFDKFDYKNPNWTVVCNRIFTHEGFRHSDWLVNPKFMHLLLIDRSDLTNILMEIAPCENGPQYVSGLSYTTNNLSHIQYVSGGYIVCKKKVLLNVPMNEELVWGQAEDVDWSQSLIYNGYRFSFNEHSVVQLQKPGKWHVYQMPIKVENELLKKFGDADAIFEFIRNLKSK